MRIRVGDYRIVYEARDGELVVLVIQIGHRSLVYDRWPLGLLSCTAWSSA